MHDVSSDRNPQYHLMSFDADGIERPDAAGENSTALCAQLEREAATDVFLLCHGWMGDVPAARRQYDAWISSMDGCPDDRAAAEVRDGGFRPSVIGVHWPSKAWGDEDLGSGSFGLQPDEARVGTEVLSLLEAFSSVLDHTPEVRESVQAIVDAALDDPIPAVLPPSVREAYELLDASLGDGADGEGSAPADDRDRFDPEAVYQASLMAEFTSFGGMSLGGLLGPLRVLTFWHMKRRAAVVGGSGVAQLVGHLQDAAPEARFHLMGHSFGCIVVSAAVAGGKGPDRRPVTSLALVQGAMSLWSYCSSIPSVPDRSGYFHRVVRDRLVAGPVVVTTSVHDRAVGTFYPIGAGSRGQVEYAPGELPTYGAIGAFGLRGPGLEIVEDDLHPIDEPYTMEPGVIHVLRGDHVIRDGGGIMGAHSDIAKPEVAHAVWQAALAGSRQ